MATLAELRARKSRSLPTAARRISLDLDLLADVQRLEAEKRDIGVAAAQKAATAGDRDGSQAVRKMGEGADPRLAEIDAALGALYERLRASEGEVLLRGVTGAEWQAWKDEHPPRENNASDRDVAFGVCNATDLLNDLARYAVSWEGEEFAEGDWDGWFRDSVSPGDLRDLVTDVVSMHELSGVRAPKLPDNSSATEPVSSD